MLDFLEYLREKTISLLSKCPELSKSYDVARKIYMCITTLLGTESDEIRQSCFAFTCLIRVRLDTAVPVSNYWQEDAREALKAFDAHRDEVNSFFMNDCLAWAKEIRELQDEFDRHQVPLKEQTDFMKECLEEDRLAWTKRHESGSYTYWNVAAAWRELWEVYSTTSCSSAPDCIHKRHFGLLESLLGQTHAEIRRKCMLAVGARLPVELVDVVQEFALLAEGVPIRSTTWTEVEVHAPPPKPYTGTSTFERWKRSHCVVPLGPRIEKHLHTEYKCASMSQAPWHHLWP